MSGQVLKKTYFGGKAKKMSEKVLMSQDVDKNSSVKRVVVMSHCRYLMLK